MQAGKLLHVRYHGQDARNRPYTVTADEAVQAGPDRIDLVQPKGRRGERERLLDLRRVARGRLPPARGLLDMSGDVVLYRDDGVTCARNPPPWT